MLNDRLDGPSLGAVFGSLVDVLEGIELDQFAEGEAPLHVEINQARNKHISNGITFDNAPQALATLHEVDGIQLQLFTGF